MPEPQIANTVKASIADIERYISEMEQRVENARRDLAHLQATMQLFKRNEADVNPVYMGLTRIFRRVRSPGLDLRAYGPRQRP
jgi:hypothetical protein